MWCKAAELAVELNQLHIAAQCFKKVGVVNGRGHNYMCRRMHLTRLIIRCYGDELVYYRRWGSSSLRLIATQH